MMKESALMQRIDKFLEENRDAFLKDLAALIEVDSVRSEPVENGPFGSGVRKAMDRALEIADRFGLSTRDCSGYLVYADVPGKSEKQIAAITHLDVVPAGNGWDCDPFQLTRREGFVLGRGVADDKGPAVITLYLAKFFQEYCQETGETLPYTLRILLGGAEETGMEDVDYYLEHYPMPAFCFTPDAEFPVGHGEKGGFGGTFVSAPLRGNLVDFQGGVANNVVPDLAYALVRCDISGLKESDGISLAQEENGIVRITGHGKGGHASTPEGTVNAIALVTDYLLRNQLCSDAENRYLTMLQQLLASTDGSSFGIAATDTIFTPLTCIGGVISMEEGILRQTIDVRYPTSITAEEIEAACGKLAKQGDARFVAEKSRVPFYIPADSPEIEACIRSYNEVTGRNDKPFTMGGGTYARHFKNAVSFGIEEPEAAYPDFVGQMHGANEGVPEALLFQPLKIYILAVTRLMKLSF